MLLASWDRACTTRQVSKMSLNVTACQLSFYVCSVFALAHSLTANQYLTQKWTWSNFLLDHLLGWNCEVCSASNWVLRKALPQSRHATTPCTFIWCAIRAVFPVARTFFWTQRTSELLLRVDRKHVTTQLIFPTVTSVADAAKDAQVTVMQLMS